ncbi:MAG: CoA transferase [SAR202 cluster bacterium]|nr:CoA transferase [SAR202 cluster bacterium]
MPGLALDHFNVLDLSGNIAGPFCAKLLADYGAEVIKIEPPGHGDPARSAGPFFKDDPHPEKSLLYFYLNCNKRGVTLNLENSSGRKIFLELVKKADVLIESFLPGYMAKLGLGYEDLEKINPGLVVLSITHFGQDGPYKDYAGNDLAYYAMSGMMLTSGAYAREPLKHGHPQSYYMGGIIGSYTVSAALFSRYMTGEGQHIDLSLAECVAAHNYDSATRYVYSGTIERRAPKVEAFSTKGIQYEGIVPTKDGYISPTMQKGRPTAPFKEYATLLGHPELENPKYDTRQKVLDNREEVDDLLLPIIKNEWKKFDYYNTFMEEGFVAGVVQTSEDLVNCPQLDERGYFIGVEHPVIGKIKYPGEMFRLPDSPWSLRRPAPLLGQHNREVYCRELKYSKDDLVLLRQQGAI